MPGDVQILASGVSAAPLTYTIPATQEILLKALFASFDGSGSASAFLPCVRIVAPSGVVVGEYITDTTVAAGGSAGVSFAPFLRAHGGGGATAATADYALASLDCTSTLFANGFIQMFPADYLAIGNPAMFQDDGSGRIQIIATGLYEITWTVQLYSPTLPAANTPNIIERFISTSTPNQITLNDPGTFAGFPGSTVGTATYWNVWETGWIDLLHPSVSVYMTIFGGGATHTLYNSATATVRIVRLTEASSQGL